MVQPTTANTTRPTTTNGPTTSETARFACSAGAGSYASAESISAITSVVSNPMTSTASKFCTT